MRLMEHFQLLQRVDGLIRRKSTGRPEEFAERLKITRSAMYRRLDDLKSIGAPIKYDRFSRSFYYDEPFRLPFVAGKEYAS